MFTLYQEPEIQELNPPINPNSIRLFIKREDQIHPVISGNKWRKLKYNLKKAKEEGYTTLLTFGGAYSNHIHALAGAAKEYRFQSIGIIRGEEHLPLNPTLRQATKMGMRLYYMDRTTYRNKQTQPVIDELNELFGEFYLVPEGGTNELAIKGASEIVAGCEGSYDYVVAPCGTAGTITGIISGLNGLAKAIGVAVLKGDFHVAEVEHWLDRVGMQELKNWSIETGYHFGGYAKYDWELIKFINSFRINYGIQLDPIYTGKMMFALFDLIAKGAFEKDSQILAIHTGGLQGIKGFNKRFNNLLIT
jgi:1-aminocyclopropane-1-carboxylate deaminase/D-cysteine desulfhydrase-like pyridoxal-dependent ACC family enzyme